MARPWSPADPALYDLDIAVPDDAGCELDRAASYVGLRDVTVRGGQTFLNGARLHQKVFEPRYHYWADRLGYLTWAESPSWGLDLSSPEAARNFLSEWATVGGSCEGRDLRRDGA